METNPAPPTNARSGQLRRIEPTSTCQESGLTNASVLISENAPVCNVDIDARNDPISSADWPLRDIEGDGDFPTSKGQVKGEKA
jgi:hypothetical protein